MLLTAFSTSSSDSFWLHPLIKSQFPLPPTPKPFAQQILLYNWKAVPFPAPSCLPHPLSMSPPSLSSAAPSVIKYWNAEHRIRESFLGLRGAREEGMSGNTGMADSP